MINPRDILSGYRRLGELSHPSLVILVPVLELITHMSFWANIVVGLIWYLICLIGPIFC